MKIQLIAAEAAPSTFNLENYHELCDHLTSQDDDLKAILAAQGYPPMWTRDNTFEALVHKAMLRSLKKAELVKQMLEEGGVFNQRTIYHLPNTTSDTLNPNPQKSDMMSIFRGLLTLLGSIHTINMPLRRPPCSSELQ